MSNWYRITASGGSRISTAFPAKETRVTVLLGAAPVGTELKIRMENFETAEERDANRQAWQRGLSTLADIVGESAGGRPARAEV
jgi:hypothetical protein